MLFASSLAILANAYPGHAERAQAFALYGATIGASFALGPFVGGALTSGFSWQAVFYANLPFGILALVASFAWLRESNDPAARRVDWPGQATLTAGLFLLVLALLRGNQEGWASTRILAEYSAEPRPVQAVDVNPITETLHDKEVLFAIRSDNRVS